MAIKFKKKEEKKRNTPLIKFIGVAFIPLFITFIGGFSVGNTNSVDRKDWHEKYWEVKDQNDKLFDAITGLDSILRNYDSLKIVALADSDEVLRELLNSYKTGDPSQINQWKNRTYYAFDGKWTRLITDLNTDSESTDNLINKKPLINLLQELFFIHKQHINAKELHQQSLVQQNSADAVAGDASQNQIVLLQMQHLAETNQLNGQMGQLQMQLNNCQGQASGTKEKLTETMNVSTRNSSDNYAHVGEILGQVQSIRETIIPDLKAGFLGRNRGRIEEIKDELSGVLNNIAESAGKID